MVPAMHSCPRPASRRLRTSRGAAGAARALPGGRAGGGVWRADQGGRAARRVLYRRRGGHGWRPRVRPAAGDAGEVGGDQGAFEVSGLSAVGEALSERQRGTNQGVYWQSKAATTLDSVQGRRHVQAAEVGVTPLLLVREKEKDGARTLGFRYLGPVAAIAWSGERPISVEWELKYLMPSEVLVVGRVA